MTTCQGDFKKLLLWLKVDAVYLAIQSCGNLARGRGQPSVIQERLGKGKLQRLLISGDKIMTCICRVLCVSQSILIYTSFIFTFLRADIILINYDYGSKRGFMLNKSKDIASFVYIESSGSRTALGTC